SLGGPPQVLAGGAHGYLLLRLALASSELELRGYPLPITQSAAQALPIVKVTGGAEFPPWHNGGQLAVATDHGSLQLFGINQPGQRDPWSFPWLQRPEVLEKGLSGC